MREYKITITLNHDDDTLEEEFGAEELLLNEIEKVALPMILKQVEEGMTRGYEWLFNWEVKQDIN